MIERLSVRNFILVDALDLEFTPGFNVLTGETGAGKSILVGALSVLCGGRAAADLVRSGADEAVVAGEFRVADNQECLAWLQEREISPEDGVVLVRRTLRTSGRGTIYMQSIPLTRGDLEEFSSMLLDLHSQHEHQSLFHESAHRRLLDRYAGLEEPVEHFGQQFAALTEMQNRLRELSTRVENQDREREILRHAVEEIDGAALTPGEMESLEQERDRMLQYERLVEHMEQASSVLDGEAGQPGDGVGVPSLAMQIRHVRQELLAAARLDSGLDEYAQRLESLYFELEDLTRGISTYRQELVHDPVRLDEIEGRLGAMRDVLRKYGGSIEAALAYRDEAEETLGSMDAREEQDSTLREEIRTREQQLIRDARELHEHRVAGARELQGAISAILGELALGTAEFLVEVERRTGDTGRLVCGPHGADNVRFLISTNPGEAPRPLSRVASGGELSRVMLAIKTVLAAADNVRALLFDEIDSGIGGKVALALASHMRTLSSHGQVICITHLATIAVHADNHILVRKDTPGERTVIGIEVLDGESRITEIARMLAGDGEEHHSVEHARALLNRYRRQ